LRQSRAERAAAGAALFPTLEATVPATARHGTHLSSSPAVDAGWEPDVFGGARMGVAAAAADADAVAEDLRAAHVSLAAEVALTYAELRTQQARLVIARQNEVSQTETLTLTGFREQAGLVSRVDVEQALANVDQTRAQLPALDTGIAQAIHRLSTLAGRQPGALVSILSPLAPLPSVPAQVAVAIPTEALRQRPDVRAAERRIVAETARLGQQQAQRYPQFALSGSLGVGLIAGVATGGTSLLAAVAGSVTQTVFDGGRIRQQIAVRSAIQEQAVAGYDGTVLAALAEVENALVAFDGSRLRLVSLDAAAGAAASAAALARAQYAAGLADFQTVLDTERTVLSIQDSVASTRGDRVSALVQLYKAVGGGWSPAATPAPRRQIP
jgi:NodT family efflux transporter outer membrane factor (OMF) lipoprotein